MKKIIYLMASALLFAGLTSCNKQEPDYGVRFQSVLINVPQKSWTYSNIDNNNYFCATVDMPEITEYAFDNGLVKLYRTYNFDSSNPTQIEMPYIHPMERFFPEENYWEFYNEELDYEFGIGTLTIFFTMSNFDYEVDESLIPENMQFRCVIGY